MKTILLAYGGSPAADRALNTAAELAQLSGSAVTVLGSCRRCLMALSCTSLNDYFGNEAIRGGTYGLKDLEHASSRGSTGPRTTSSTTGGCARFERYSAEIFTALGLDLATPATVGTPWRHLRVLIDARPLGTRATLRS